MRPSVTRKIGGYEVSTTHLRPTEALKLAPKLVKIVTPALRLLPVFGPLMSAPEAGVEVTPGLVMAALGRLDITDLVGAITELLGTLDDATLDLLYRKLLADTSIAVPDDNGKLTSVDLNSPDMIDRAFGQLDDGVALLVEVMLFVGEVNFKRSFFGLTNRLGLKAKPKTVLASTSPAS